jgi:hypothetical protein
MKRWVQGAVVAAGETADQAGLGADVAGLEVLLTQPAKSGLSVVPAGFAS